jgi:type II restriction/modification system DNA methylase subunit YeeA
MVAMNITQIEQNIKKLLESFNQDTFIYDLLLAYGLPKASISRLQKGSLNLSKSEAEILWKKKLFFKVVTTDELYSITDSYKNQPDLIKHDPRFIIITDYQQLLAIDTKTYETLDSKIIELDKCFDFFLPWAGMEKATYQGENPADVKAAEKMAKLFDEIRKDNQTLTSKEQLHSLNVFLSRLLFCFFAEDTGIFEAKQFTNALKNYTQLDGSDLHEYLAKIFVVMNQKERNELPDYIGKFPYVNGGLFRDNHPVPQFSFKSRQLLLENGDLDWSVINPDIFGSMMQAVVDSAQRSGLGMHYTSVPNIMKVIEPLFLNELKEEFEKSQDSKTKLEKLLARISNIKIFDPACGSGNFLIIAYKELRNLEIAIMQRIDELTGKPSMMFSQIHLSSFYGIEIDDFAHEIAKLSLWLAEHQMNLRFEKEFGRTLPALPLKDSGNIVCTNACRIDWDKVCPKTTDDEIYVLGNPPYLGSRNQNQEQKYDMMIALEHSYKSLDYIACWFIKASRYIIGFNAQFAFVSTNSICQGEQVALLWSRVFEVDLEISFAYQSFKWLNNAKGNAAVIVVIIGLCNKNQEYKFIFNNKDIKIVKEISPYLTSNKTNYIFRQSSPLSGNLQKIVYGNLLNDGGHLVIDAREKDYFINKYPKAKDMIFLYLGSKEYIRGEKRWCFYISDENLEYAESIPEIVERLLQISAMRASSTEKSTRQLSNMPHKYYFTSYCNSPALIIPRTSSERREYIPIGFVENNVIISDAAQAIYNPSIFTFGIISSKIHMTWVRAVAGRLKTDYRYSSALCYNTFPFPDISAEQKKRIEMYVFDVLDEREKHSEKTLAELYDPDKMPDGLRQAHHNLDLAIEQCYRTKPFASDEERLEHLFTLYEQMTAKGAK